MEFIEYLSKDDLPPPEWGLEEIKEAIKGIGLEAIDQKLVELRDYLNEQFSEGVAKVILYFVQNFLFLFGRSIKEIGFLIGSIYAIKELGSQASLSEIRPTLLAVDQLITARLRREISESEFESELAKLGFSDRRIEVIKNISYQVLPLTMASTLYFRGWISKEEFHRILEASGFKSMDMDGVIESFRPVLDTSTILELYRRGEIDQYRASEELTKHGFDEDSKRLLLKLKRTLIDPNLFIRAWLREEISEEDVHYYLSQRGYSDDDINLIKKLAFYVPPPADLIRMAVREAFSPEIAERFGQFEDYPEEFDKYAKWQGISSEWARRYWASHWELPSLSMGYEMLHRGIITKEELELLMRAQDVMPFWREKLIQLSYNPYTRVDIRRMFTLGVLNREEVFKAYKDLGYDDERAEKLTQFTELSVLEEERDLTKSEVLTAYQNNIIDRNQAITHLKALNYSDIAIDTLIALTDYKKEAELRKSNIEAVRIKYINETIDQNEAVRMLTSLALKGSEIQNYIELWNNQKKVKAVDLDLTTLKNAYKIKLISREEFKSRLKKKGYNDKDADLIIDLTEKGK